MTVTVFLKHHISCDSQRTLSCANAFSTGYAKLVANLPSRYSIKKLRGNISNYRSVWLRDSLCYTNCIRHDCARAQTHTLNPRLYEFLRKFKVNDALCRTVARPDHGSFRIPAQGTNSFFNRLWPWIVFF